MTEQEIREAVAKKAASYVGVRRSEGGHRQFCDRYNRFIGENGVKIAGYPRKTPMSYDYAWCCCFASAIAIELGYAMTQIPVEISCRKAIAMWMAMGRWAEADDYVPRPGDYVYFDHEGTVKGDSAGISTADHVGIVERVTGSSFTSVEGNVTLGGYSQVGRKTHKINGSDIAGYGLPDYASLAEAAGNGKADGDGAAAVTEAPEKVAKTVEKVAEKSEKTVGKAAEKSAVATEAAAKAGEREITLTLPLLKAGSRGKTVEALQALLNLRRGCGLKCDGSFGSKTLGEVRGFQKEAGIAVDGIVGTVTWGRLLKEGESHE